MIKCLVILGALVAMGRTREQLRNYGLPIAKHLAQYHSQLGIPPPSAYGLSGNYQYVLMRVPIGNAPAHGFPAAPPGSAYGPPANNYVAPSQFYGPPGQAYGLPPSLFQYYGVPGFFNQGFYPTLDAGQPEQGGLVPTAPKSENTLPSTGTPSQTAGVPARSPGIFQQFFGPHKIIPASSEAQVQPEQQELAASNETPSNTVEEQSGAPKNPRQVFEPQNFFPTSNLFLSRPPEPPATYISPPRQAEDIDEETVFCI